MAQRKPAEDTRTQRQKFIDAARKAEASDDEDAFDQALRRIATAPVRKPKKAARRRK